MSSVSSGLPNQPIQVTPHCVAAPAVESADAEQLRRLFAYGHINVLLGAGFSCAVLPTLGNREHWLTWCQQNHWNDSADQEKCETLLQLEYFDSVLRPMAGISPTSEMREFVNLLCRIIEMRGNVTIPRRMCLFTTNYDPLLELSMEEESRSCNDGFEGRVHPIYSTRTFSRVQYSQSLSMEYSAPVPTVNIIKLHGSVTWEMDLGQNAIRYHDYKKAIESFAEKHNDLLTSSELAAIKSLVSKRVEDAAPSVEGLVKSATIDGKPFLEDYHRNFYIINPTKRKFEETVMGLTYYELLRIYANELDRNNALLLCFGFSFEDEHVLEITKRALENTSLILLICCYSEDSIEGYVAKFGKRSNVWYLTPSGVGSHLGLVELCDVLGLIL